MGGSSSLFADVVVRESPNWYMVVFNVTAFVISTLFIIIIVGYLNAKVGYHTIVSLSFLSYLLPIVLS